MYAGPREIVLLFAELKCPRCDLQRSDLVQAALTEANLEGADLEKANLSGANLDRANLRNANLSFTSLNGASLRGASLLGAKLHGTDLRGADLSGAQVTQSALQEAHWQNATGIQNSMLSYAELHNAGTEAATKNQWQQAEKWFSAAIHRKPDAAVSWLARGLTRAEEGDLISASQDLSYAGKLYKRLGDNKLSDQLHNLSESIRAPRKRQRDGNGAGIAAVGGTLSVLRMLAPLAMKILVPMGL